MKEINTENDHKIFLNVHSLMSAITEPHTIDNLCKSEKAKVVEMMKQLSELRKRSVSLQAEIDAQILVNQKLEGSGDVMTQQLAQSEQKLFDAIQLSKNEDYQIDRLTQQLQKTQSERNRAQAKHIQSSAEVEALREEYRQLKLKYDHVLVDTSSQCISKTNDMSVNTDDLKENCTSITCDSIQMNSGSETGSQIDDDTITLIKMLNNL